MTIEYVTLTECVRCGSGNFTETTFNEIHGYRYECKNCGFTGWGGREKNKVKNEKRPPCPTSDDLKVYSCNVCQREERFLGYSETLEVHHMDGDPANNDRLNLWVLCTVCHKFVHHQRQYRGVHFMMKFGELL